MAKDQRLRGKGVVGTVVLLACLVVLALLARGEIERARDRLFGSDAPVAVPILRQEATSADAPRRTWTIDVAAGQTLIVDASSVDLVRDDEGSRISNASADRILLAAEGGHRYTVTLEDGRWVLVAETDGRREFCNQQRSRHGPWGVRYRPSTWSSDPC